MADHINLYEVLGIDRAESTERINEELLGRLRHLHAAGTPEGDAEVQKTLIGRGILGDDELRRTYDERLDDDSAPAMTVAALREFQARRAFPDAGRHADPEAAPDDPSNSATEVFPGGDLRRENAAPEGGTAPTDGGPSYGTSPNGPTPAPTGPSYGSAATGPQYGAALTAPAGPQTPSQLKAVTSAWPGVVKFIGGGLSALSILGALGVLASVFLRPFISSGAESEMGDLLGFFGLSGDDAGMFVSTIFGTQVAAFTMAVALAGILPLARLLARREPLTGWVVSAVGTITAVAALGLIVSVPIGLPRLYLFLVLVAAAVAAVAAALPDARTWFAGGEVKRAQQAPQQPWGGQPAQQAPQGWGAQPQQPQQPWAAQPNQQPWTSQQQAPQGWGAQPQQPQQPWAAQPNQQYWPGQQQ
ncbi:hypothetical protein [Corynebacterium sp.]|uniref:hypothetical protein n=1 Tax=Corynebacterium sp. TaxID=1720 RepID=UPI0026DC2E29|nr:hypothetical protein [Corynebacterium sp.]MDO4610492.1 hypothetical protein [Corynebacterium sp.]